MIHYPASPTVTLCSQRIESSTDMTRDAGRITCVRCKEVLAKIIRMRGMG